VNLVPACTHDAQIAATRKLSVIGKRSGARITLWRGWNKDVRGSATTFARCGRSRVGSTPAPSWHRPFDHEVRVAINDHRAAPLRVVIQIDLVETGMNAADKEAICSSGLSLPQYRV
jgi:hypothetical protein